MSTQPQPLNFDDLGAKTVSANGGLDFSDLGAKSVTTTQTPPASGQNTGKDQGDYLSKTENLIDSGENFVTDVAKGFAKGAGQTANTISKGISKVAPSIVRPSDVQALEQIETPTNTAQKIGVAGEGIAEFFLMDEGLKALSVAERLGLAAKVAKLAESHPAVAKLIGLGLNAVRTGSVGTAQGLAHGETAGQA